jgi:magnesium transporter
VKADAVVLFDTYGSADSRLHSMFLYHLEVSAIILYSPRHADPPSSTISEPKVTGCPTSSGTFDKCPSQRFPLAHGSSRALESILLSVLGALEAEMVFIRNLVGGLLAELEDDINHDKFKRLLHYSRRLASFQNRAQLVCGQISLRLAVHWACLG